MNKFLILALGCCAGISATAQSYNMTITRNDGKIVSIPTNDISRIDFVQRDDSEIVADLLDIQFKADGTAVDVSPMQHEVVTTPGPNLITYYNDIHKRYVANFRNEMGVAVNSSYYRVNYTRGDEFINRIADGCTFESIIKLNTNDAPGREVKWFSSMQAGGIGFILPVHTTSSCITFLPNISTTGGSNWCWTHSTVTPEVGKYYHVVGVWNKTEGKTYIYINGQLSGLRNSPGNYVPVTAGAESFVIGGDPATDKVTCDASFNGEVVTARIYDDPLTADQVAALWEKNKFDEDAVNGISVTDLMFLPVCTVSAGSKYYIYGKGFDAGDTLTATSIATNQVYQLETEVADGCISCVVPQQFASGDYKIILVREAQQLPLLQVTMNVAPGIVTPKTPEVIAHRGEHIDGATENSLASLIKAMNSNYYGIELDTWITTDGVIVVHHDGVANGLTFQNCTYDQIKNITLANGEKLPTFNSFLDTYISNMQHSDSKLIIEFKTHNNDARNQACVDQVMEKIKSFNLENRVEYIAFSLNTCKYIVSKDANAIVGYLNGDLAPQAVASYGIKSIDYNSGVFVNNREWIKQALDLGVIVNVWTVNNAGDMLQFIGQGADYITTDAPALLDEISHMKFIE